MKVENCLQYGFDLFRHFTLSIGVLSGPAIDRQNSMTNSNYVTTFHPDLVLVATLVGPESLVRPCDLRIKEPSTPGCVGWSSHASGPNRSCGSDSGNLTSGNRFGDVGTRFRTGGGTVDGQVRLAH
jgi:hypothetical protein